MPISGKTFTRTDGTRTGTQVWEEARDAGVKILAADHDTHDQDIGSALNTILPELQAGSWLWAGDVSASSNVLTITMTPAITSYVSGQMIRFKCTGNNSGAVTAVVNGLASKAVNANGLPLNANALVSGSTYTMIYDGADFQLFGTLPQTDYELISTVEASSSAALVFTGIGTTYSEITFTIEELVPGTDNSYTYFNTSSVGTTFGSTSIYDTSLLGNLAGTAGGYGSNNDSSLKLQSVGGIFSGTGNGANESLSSEVTIQKPYSTAHKHGFVNTAYTDAALGRLGAVSGGIAIKTTSTVRGVQFFQSSGNIKSGIIRMYGKRGA